MNSNLKNKVAIITGARRGMGKADALLLSQVGAKVVVADISQEECQLVADEIKKNGGEALAIKWDVNKKKEMAKQKPGVIVNIASVGMGQIGKGMAGLAHYSASKGGIAALTKTLALELAPYNIRVNAISPGAIDTPMAASSKIDPKMLEATL